ncbi:hypothetical protein FO488_16000 [Geobacter sp. FeAm09]|uniref:hypothetical protein n=1 Tax=Geobacter sp. FeAm09 TaxID=2597769 RepID=UPI0011EC774C|nr:hypothetical protein [Geobacter sp. FeAm09]QEM69511.1 hypothetical protein FO488_16000 [Geobacter sp. FeAm09]
MRQMIIVAILLVAALSTHALAARPGQGWGKSEDEFRSALRDGDDLKSNIRNMCNGFGRPYGNSNIWGGHYTGEGGDLTLGGGDLGPSMHIAVRDNLLQQADQRAMGLAGWRGSCVAATGDYAPGALTAHIIADRVASVDSRDGKYTITIMPAETGGGTVFRVVYMDQFYLVGQTDPNARYLAITDARLPIATSINETLQRGNSAIGVSNSRSLYNLIRDYYTGVAEPDGASVVEFAKGLLSDPGTQEGFLSYTRNRADDAAMTPAEREKRRYEELRRKYGDGR